MDANDYRLDIYFDKQILVIENKKYVFKIGPPSASSVEARKEIEHVLNEWYLDKIYSRVTASDYAPNFETLDENLSEHLRKLAESIASEYGRAIAGLAFMQLVIKSIRPDRCIRLHKSNSAKHHFSWEEGVPMRSIDKLFITPWLREKDLLRFNRDGVMMTRSLAENLPYCRLYPAKIRGAKDSWIEIVECLEVLDMDYGQALEYFLMLLVNRSEAVEKIGALANKKIHAFIKKTHDNTFNIALHLIKRHYADSVYGARLFEVCLHTFKQALEDLNLLSGWLVPLQQMRSANKKHGNIADIEIKACPNDDCEIIEAWEAKYSIGKFHIELQELKEKLAKHKGVVIAGFITDLEKVDVDKDLLAELRKSTKAEIKILSLDEFVSMNIGILEATQQDLDMTNIGKQWLIAYTETLSRRREEKAPIDEPVQNWLKEWIEIIDSYQN